MSSESETNQIQELQALEQNRQNLLLQKQSFQLELHETQNALQELEISKGKSFKLIGNLMLETEKQEMKKELEEKQKVFELRLKSFEKQEQAISERAEKLRKDIINKNKDRK